MEKIKVREIKLRENDKVKLPFKIEVNTFEGEDPYVQFALIEYEVIKELVKGYNDLKVKYKKLKERNK